MARKRPEFTFDARGLPTLAKRWDGSAPELEERERTSTGRLAAGRVAELVDNICKRWSTGDFPDSPEMCTVTWIAARASELEGREVAPSAVYQALLSWSELGYAISGDSPRRFIGFTTEGMSLGLDEIRRRARRRRKSTHYDWDNPRPRPGRKTR